MTRFVANAKNAITRLAPMAAIFGAFFLTQAVNAQSVYCSNGTMRGTYVVQGTGSIITPTGAVPFATVGQVTYFGDGTGSVTSSTTNMGGTVSRTTAPVAGTYSVKPDCTGTKILGGVHYDFVISPNGRLISWVVTESGVVISGTAVKLDGSD
jgi:hypothetical protein